jgi:hypothetical protein
MSALFRLRRHAAPIPLVFALLGAAAASGALAVPIELLPQYAGSFAAGGGADTTFLQIDGNWHGSTVLWDDATQTYGSGAPIGSYAWGTGLWGRADWQAIETAALGGADTGAARIINRWSGIQPTINFANALYNTNYSATWGAATLVPFFQPADPVSAQEDWTVHVHGYIRITQAGAYDLSVLNDDGYFLRLVGAGGAVLEASRDFLNPRERNGFADSLLLSPGLYGLEIGMWNHLEAGVVDLRWHQPGSSNWELVPTTSLLPLSAVTEPAGTALLAAGLAVLTTTLRRQRRAPVRHA